MGASGSEGEKQKDFKSALLICLVKIKELEQYFKSFSFRQTMELSEIFYFLVRSVLDLKSQVEVFNEIIKNKNLKDNDIFGIFQYIIKELHEELNESNVNEEKKINEEFPSYEEFIENLKKFHNSIIQKLFFGTKKRISTCQKNNNQTFENYYAFYIEYFDLSSAHGKIELKDLINEKLEKQEEIKCPYCLKNTKHLSSSSIFYFPEILIMFFENKENKDFSLSYYQKIEIGNEDYNLICFIIDRDEFGEEANDYNVFYKKNKSWFIFKVYYQRTKNIDDISKIKGNPIITFFQKDKALFYNYYKYIKLLFQDQINTKNLIYEHLIPEMKFEKYYLVKEENFNKIIKIYQSKEQFEDKNIIIHSIKDLVNIKKLDPSELEKKYQEFVERKSQIKDLVILDYDYCIKEDKSYTYPANFVIIKQKLLEDLLDELKMSKVHLNDYLYEIIFGENFAFIKDKENVNEIIFVCTFNENNFVFQVIALLIYNKKDRFLEEAKKFICNRAGLEYYYQKRNLVFDTLASIKINDEKKQCIGKLINLVNMKDYINEFKYGKNEINNKVLGNDEKTNTKNKKWPNFI